MRRHLSKLLTIHDDVIICAYVTIPFDKPVLSEPFTLRQAQGERSVEGLRVTGHGEPVEPCAGYSLGNDSHAQLFMTVCITD